MSIRGIEVSKYETFYYLGSIIQKHDGIKDVDNRIKLDDRLKMASGALLCHKRMSTWLKGKSLQDDCPPAMIYGTKC